MLVVKTYLDRSKIHGIGLFAAEFIPKDKKVVLFETTFIREITVADMKQWKGNEFAESIIKKHVWTNEGKYYISLDDDHFTNHSEQPNTYCKDKDVFAACDIKEGEEITTNYDIYEQGAKFEELPLCLL